MVWSEIVALTDCSTKSANDLDKIPQLSPRVRVMNEDKTPPLSPFSDPSCEDQSGDEIETSTTQHVEMKPFFIMDWLEQLDDHNMNLARGNLEPQSNEEVSNLVISSSPLSLPEQVCLQSQSIGVGEDISPLSSYMRSPSSPQSCFLKRSIAIGNGWNAKGLQKAKHGRWEEALLCWQNALEIRVQVMGNTHLDVANTCNNIGIALGKLDRTDEAMISLQKSLSIRTQHFGLCSSEVAATLHNMGNVLQQAGDLKAAVECFSETMKIQKEVFGPDDVQVARACVAMGHTYFQAMEYEDALEAYSDSLLIFRRAGLDSSSLEVRSVLTDMKYLKQPKFSSLHSGF